MSVTETQSRVLNSITAAASFLAKSQDRAGFWRDYLLPPGRSEAWTTAYVGCALHRAAEYAGTAQTTLQHAADALVAIQRSEGWGYNRNTACDGDSTSWVLRFLATARAEGISGLNLLAPYIAPTGRVRTFQSVQQFGSWGMEHDEVTPVAGLALLAEHQDEQVSRLRGAVLNAWATSGWKQFWWRCRAYVCAQSFEFLSHSGGIPANVLDGERTWLINLPPPLTAFETAQSLSAAVHLQVPLEAKKFLERLLDLQCADGGWRPSWDLLVPHQNAPSLIEVYSDDKRLLTTAAAVVAMVSWCEY
jgi:hypothetical protein